MTSDKVNRAMALMASGNVPQRVERSTGGRPAVRWQIGPMELTAAEYEALGKLESKKRTVFSQEDLVELARSGVPGLLERAHSLAMQSDDIRAILLVAKELMDRSFGKAVQGVQVSMGDDITAAWKQLGVIDVEVSEEKEASGGGEGETEGESELHS